MEGFIILDWVSVVSLIISTVISIGIPGGIGYFFKRKFEKDRRKFEEDRDKLKREFEKDLLSIKTNFEKEIYTYKARYDHKVKMMMEMFECVNILDLAAWGVCWMSDGKLHDCLEKYKELGVELEKCVTFYNKYRPFVKKEVIENFRCFYYEVNVFMDNVYVFCYERRFLIEKDKNPQDKCDKTSCENIRIYYKDKIDTLSKDYKLIRFRDVGDIKKWYIELRKKLIDSLTEQVREYLNEK